MTDARFHTVWIPLQEHFYRVAYYILEDRADALDAVQDLYMKLWKIRDSLDLVRNPGAYGALLMRNLCIDRIRRALRRNFSLRAASASEKSRTVRRLISL